MTFTKTAILVEIVGLVLVLTVVEWLSAVLTHTNSFWPEMTFAAIYIAVRFTLLARKARAARAADQRAGRPLRDRN
jgi:hypothetical protein